MSVLEPQQNVEHPTFDSRFKLLARLSILLEEIICIKNHDSLDVTKARLTS
jgi:hypothetical protein